MKSIDGIPIMDFICMIKTSYQMVRLRLNEPDFQELCTLMDRHQGFGEQQWTPFTNNGALYNSSDIIYFVKAPKHSGSAFGMDTFSIHATELQSFIDKIKLCNAYLYEYFVVMSEEEDDE